MKNQTYLKGLLLVMSSTALASCGGGAVSSFTTSLLSSTESTTPVISDVKGMVDYLASTQDFRLDFEIYDANGDVKETYYRYYTENYVYDEAELSGWGYAKLGDKFAELSPDSNGVRIGYEVVGKKSLYDGSFPTFSDFGNDIVSGSDSIKISAKKSKLLFLNLFNLDAGEFSNIKGASLSFSQGVLDGYITVGTSFDAHFTVDEIGSARSEAVEKATKDGKPYVNDLLENQITDMFAENNYQRNCYENDVFIGAEHFLPRYFYGEYTDEYKASSGAYSYGLIGLDNVKLSATISEGLTKGVVYNGSYYFSIYANSVSIVTTNPYNVNPNVCSKDVYNYPSNMVMWKKLYMFDHWDDGEVVEFVSNRTEFAVDFAKNFQIYDTLINAKCSPSSLKLTCKDLDGANAKITFTIGYTYQGSEYYSDYEFDHFGTANKQEADAFLEKVDRLNENK